MDDKDPTKKNIAALLELMSFMPSVEELIQLKDLSSLKKFLDQKAPLAFPLLRWIIASNRAHLAKLDPKDRIEKMKLNINMFLSPSEKESKFQMLKAKKGSFMVQVLQTGTQSYK